MSGFSYEDAAKPAATSSGGGFSYDEATSKPESSHPQGDIATQQLQHDLTTPAPRSTLQDVRQGVAHGLVSAGSTILGFPADLWHMLKSENKWALTRGAEAAGIITPEQGAAFREEGRKEVPTLSSLITGNTTPQPSFAEPDVGGSAWIARHVKELAKSHGKDVSSTQTVPGQYAETAATFVPLAAAAPFLGGAEVAPALRAVPAALVRYGLLPAATSETAGQLTKGTALEPYARVAGAIAPEAGFQAIGAAGRALNPMTGVMEGASPQQLQKAQQLLEESRAAGAPLTVPEALQSATGSGTRAGDLQRVVEQSPRGAEIMRPFMAERPGQTEALGRQTLGEISPTAGNPYEVPVRVQTAADATMQDAAAARTQQVDPFYKAAATDRVPAQDMSDFLKRIDGMIAKDKTGILSSELSDLRSRLIETPAKPGIPAQRVPTTTPTGATIYKTVPAVPPTPEVPIRDIENLDTARKFFRDRLDQPQWAQDPTTKAAQGQMSTLLGDLRQKMISASPDFAAGKNLYQNITETSFNPLQRSPTGQLAGAETFPKQTEILFNPNPLPNSENAVSKAVRDVAKADPEAASNMVRMHLERTFNEATQNNLPGANQFGGPKFAAVVSGNSQQAKNLEAAVRALPQGDLRWNALRKGLDIMEGMGTRQPVGSQTAFNAQIQKHLSQGHPAGEFLVQAASPGRWPSLVDRVYRHIMFDRNTGALANLFTTGSVADLQAIAQAGPRSLNGQMAVIAALAREGAPPKSKANDGLVPNYDAKGQWIGYSRP